MLFEIVNIYIDGDIIILTSIFGLLDLQSGLCAVAAVAFRALFYLIL